MKHLIFFLIIHMFGSLSVYGTNYYFSQSLGNDSWSGLIPVPNGTRTDGPKRSLPAFNSLMDNLAKAGDSILLRRGDRWTGSSGIAIGVAHGNPSKYIFVGAYGSGDKPTIDKTGTGEVLLCRASSNAAASYVKFQNLKLTSSSPFGSRPVGVYINEAFYTLRPHHITLDSLHIIGCLSGMILYQQNILVENCLIENNGNMASGHGIFSSANEVVFKNNVLDSNGCGSVFVHTMYISQCNNVLFEGNEIKNADDGLKLRASRNLMIKNNIIHDMYIHTIHVGGDNNSGTSNVIIDGNIIYNAPQGLRISSESGTQTLLSENILIKNNIFPAQVFISDNGPVKDIFFYNNLIHSTTNQNALFITNAINPINVQIKNNIFYKTNSNSNHSLVSFISSSGLNGITLANNLYYFPATSNNIITVGNTAYKTLSTFRSLYSNQELTGQQGNPNFVAPPADFHLSSNSTLAIDMGTDVSPSVPFDLDGLSRPLDGDGKSGAAFDIGPYEYCCLVRNHTTPTLENSIRVYPNPVKQIVSLSFDKEIPYKIMIADITGKMVLNTTSSSLLTNLDIAHLNSGVYIVHVFMKTGIEKIKILKI